MGKKNMVLVEQLRRENDEFVLWENRHDQLGKEIRQFNKKSHLTPEEDLLRKKLQKEKLMAKDKIMEILRTCEASKKKGD